MSESFELKSISKDAVDVAIEKAEHYRLLNEPDEAESICLDVLEVAPDNERILTTLILAMTDRFGGAAPAAAAAVRARVDKLADEYSRAYYSGIVCEREARAFLGRGTARVFAYDGFRDAMDWYEKAEAVSPPGNDDAVLRWNSCVRTIRREHLHPHPPDEGELPLE